MKRSSSTDPIQLRQLAALSYLEPLAILREIEPTIVAIQQTPEAVAHLTDREKNKHLEKYQAAYLGILMQHMGGAHGKIKVATTELQDGDCVVRGEMDDGSVVYRRIQLKQLPPSEKNAKLEVQDILNGLKKYSASRDLIVAIWLNRNVKFLIEDLNFDHVPVEQLWFFGDATNSDLTLEGGSLRICERALLGSVGCGTCRRKFNPCVSSQSNEQPGCYLFVHLTSSADSSNTLRSSTETHAAAPRQLLPIAIG